MILNTCSKHSMQLESKKSGTQLGVLDCVRVKNLEKNVKP